MTVPKAFLFDLNGTMIDDMGYHQKAWYEILNNDLHAGLSSEAVKKEMYGKNSELLVRIFGEGRFTPEEMDKWSFEKERRYQKAYRPEMRLIDGLDVFLTHAKKKGTLLAIGSAATNFNVDFVLDNLGIRHYFNAIVSGEDVSVSKPHPETYLKLAEMLKVKPAECIVFEDAPKGVEAAANAGMQSVVITTMHEANEFTAYKNIWGYIKNYNDRRLDDLF